MRCFDESITLQGDSQSSEFEQFVIQFNYCDSSILELNCEPPGYAESQMKGKSVVILANQRSVE